MGEVHYMISEAAKQVKVEAHVLRYWEEELELPIGRTEMGHRYYTEDDIRLFRCIKDLKDQSMQLRELKDVIPEIKKAKEQRRKRTQEVSEQKCAEDGCGRTEESGQARNSTPEAGKTAQETQLACAEAEVVAADKMIQVQTLIGEALERVITENNGKLAKEVSDTVTKNVLDEIDSFYHLREAKEEERYKKLDNLIRQQQMMRREAAKTSPVARLRKIFQA